MAFTKNTFTSLISQWRILLVGLIAQSGLFLLNLFILRKNTQIKKHIHYGDKKRHRLDIYTPKSSRLSPVIIFIHGGNWCIGSKRDYAFLGKALAKKGWVIVIPNYRTYPTVTFPHFVDDAAKAVAWTVNHIQDFRGDKNQIFTMGHSAGGHIAALLTMDKKYLNKQGINQKQIKGFIGLAGPYDFLPIREEIYKKVFDKFYTDPITQPISFAGPDTPSLLLLHGTTDRIVGPGNSKRLAKRVSEKGGRAKVILYENCGHWKILLALALGNLNKVMLKEIKNFIGR